LPKLKEAVRMLGKDSSGAERDLGGLIWLRNRGGRLLARVNERGVFNVYQISRQGVVQTNKNWSRGLHEGNIAGMWTGIMVLVTSLAFVGLMVTGLTIWFRRTFLRKRNRDRSRPAAAASPAE
ncbi:MAG TPA: PepSY-associated TM helix domain-containing protein, partial [Rhabdaerophilum sp.]|nr:PepSY-associated TM helix domain-containing protein [Rhabdaerophilum sp.]